MKWFFFKKNYEVICIINFKNTLFKGFTRGGPWAPSHVKQNLNRTQKYKVIASKKITTTFFKDFTRGSKQDKIYQVFYSLRT